jgi:hypothetical protein
LLPLAHVHAAGHHPVMHRHIIGDATAHRHDVDEHDANIEQAEHGDARIVSVSWRTTIAFSLAGLVPVTAQPLTASRPSRRLLLGTTVLPTHDPPLRYTSSPAPPAFV